MKIRLGFVANSSSEAFIVKTDKSLETIEEELRELISLYNKHTEQSLCFEGVFGYPIPFTDDDKETIKIYSNFTSWMDEANVVIYSASDNTVPLGLMVWIEDIYDGIRVHLG